MSGNYGYTAYSGYQYNDKGDFVADDAFLEEGAVIETLVGKSVDHVDVEKGLLVLSDSTILEIQRNESSCCTEISLAELATTDSIITRAEFADTDEGEGEYEAWIHVLTEAGTITQIARAEGNAGNGYYLHGFALPIRIHKETP